MKSHLEMVKLAMLADPRIGSFVGRNDHESDIQVGNGFSVAAMPEFDPNIPAGSQDQYHMYSIIGQNAANTTHHHQFGDVTIFFSETSPTTFENRMVKTEDRYLIIVDQWTGQRIKIMLPTVTADQIETGKAVE